MSDQHQNEKDDSMRVWIYKGDRRAETYLYLPGPDATDAVPDDLLIVLITVSLTIRKGRHQHVFQNGHISKNLGDLKRTDDTSGGSHIGLQMIYPLAVEINRTGCDFINTGDQIHERGFTRPGFANQSDEAAFFDIQVNSLAGAHNRAFAKG